MNRKHTIILVILILFCLTALSGCGGQPDVIPRNDIPYSIEAEIVQASEDYLDLDLQIPRLSGFEGAADINAAIQEDVDTALEEVRYASELMKQEVNYHMKASLYSRYTYGYYGEIGSVCLDMSNYSGGAHGLRWLTSYNFDTETGDVLSLSQFLDKTGLGSATDAAEAIIRQITNSSADYRDDAADTIRSYNGNLPYYINSDQQLVVYFPAYSLAPYAVGIPTFIFSEDDILYIQQNTP